jgi:hypothetical protein
LILHSLYLFTENMSLYKFAWCHHAPGYAYNS